MTVTVTISGVQDLRAALSEFSERRMNAAIATALTRTAVQIKDVLKAEMSSVFDRPTPYTLNALFVRPASAASLYAETYVKDDRAGSGTPATKYLLPQIEGGRRHTKRFEVAMRAAGHLPGGWFITPGLGTKLDAYGNISRGQIIQVLSQLRITMTAGHQRNMAFDAGKQIRAQRKAGGRYFVVKPGAKSGAAPGVYLRDFIGRNITPIFKFVRSVTYQPRFNFNAIATEVAQAKLGRNVEQAIAEQAARLAASKGAQ